MLIDIVATMISRYSRNNIYRPIELLSSLPARCENTADPIRLRFSSSAAFLRTSGPREKLAAKRREKEGAFLRAKKGGEYERGRGREETEEGRENYPKTIRCANSVFTDGWLNRKSSTILLVLTPKGLTRYP